MFGLPLFARSFGAPLDPATLSLALWFRGSYGGAPWEGTASAGSSGSIDATTLGSDPTSGTAVDSFTPADFGGHAGKSLEILTGGSGIGTGNNPWWFGVLLKAYSVSNGEPDESVYQNDGVFQAMEVHGLSLVNVEYEDTDYRIQAWKHDGQEFRVASAPIALNTWTWVEGWWDGSTVTVAKNGVVLDTVSCGNGGSGPWDHYLGLSGSAYFDGAMLEVMATAGVLDSTQRAGVYAYLKARYPSAGLP